MKKILALALAASAAPLFAQTPSKGGASQFDRADSLLSRAAQTRVSAARQKEAWAAEKQNILAHEKSRAAALSQRLAEIEKKRSEFENIKKLSAEICQKTGADASALAEFSRGLDGRIAALCADPRAAEIIAPLLDDLRGDSSVPEKFSTLCEAYSKLLAADTALSREGDAVSTGVFVRASGKVSGNIAKISVERKTEGGK